MILMWNLNKFIQIVFALKPACLIKINQFKKISTMKKNNSIKINLISLILLLIVSHGAYSQIANVAKVDKAKISKLISKKKVIQKKYQRDSLLYRLCLKNQTGSISTFDSSWNFLFSDSSNYYSDEMNISKIALYRINLLIENNSSDRKTNNYNRTIDSLSKILERVASYQYWAGNFMTFLDSNLNADIPVNNGAPGGKYVVTAKFKISKIDGAIDDIKVITKNGYGMEEELVRVIKMAGKWKRAIHDGEYVDHYLNQNITFTVDELTTVGNIFNKDFCIAVITESFYRETHDTIREFVFVPEVFQTSNDENERAKATKKIYFTNNGKPSESDYFYLRLMTAFFDDSLSVSYRDAFGFLKDPVTNILTSRFILGPDSVSISIVDDLGIRKAKFAIDRKYSGATKNYSKTDDSEFILFTQEQVDTLFGEVKVVKLDSNNASFYYNRGNSKVDQQDFQGAIADFSKVIALDPTNGDAYYKRGYAKAIIKDYEGSIKDFDKLILLDSLFSQAYYNRAASKVHLTDYRGAINDYTLAINIDPKYLDAYYYRGNAKYQIDDFIGAIADFSEVVTIDSNNGEAYFMRGVMEIALDEDDSACADFTKAKELGIKNAVNMLEKYCD